MQTPLELHCGPGTCQPNVPFTNWFLAMSPTVAPLLFTSQNAAAEPAGAFCESQTTVSTSPCLTLWPDVGELMENGGVPPTPLTIIVAVPTTVAEPRHSQEEQLDLLVTVAVNVPAEAYVWSNDGAAVRANDVAWPSPKSIV